MEIAYANALSAFILYYHRNEKALMLGMLGPGNQHNAMYINQSSSFMRWFEKNTFSINLSLLKVVYYSFNILHVLYTVNVIDNLVIDENPFQY